MKKMRLMVTLRCPKKCDGCCNTGPVFDQHKTIQMVDLMKCIDEYDEVLITGGEPMLVKHELLDFVRTLSAEHHARIVYLYSSMFDFDTYYTLLRDCLIDGLQFTLHAEATDHDIYDLKVLSKMLVDYSSYCIGKSMRLSIDSRLYDRYDFSNIDFSGWDVVRKLKWLKDCPLPDGEELFYCPFNENLG